MNYLSYLVPFAIVAIAVVVVCIIISRRQRAAQILSTATESPQTTAQTPGTTNFDRLGKRTGKTKIFVVRGAGVYWEVGDESYQTFKEID